MKFHARDFSLGDAPWSGRPAEVDNDQIETVIENKQCFTVWETADRLKRSNQALNHVHQLGYVDHFDVWALHKLSKKNPL